jgi:hypothetical protein
VTLAYRRRLVDSPSYTLNHEEVEKALEEGIRFAEGLTPIAVEIDVRPRTTARRHGIRLPTPAPAPSDGELAGAHDAVAAGTQPNTVLARETRTIQLDGKYFRAVDEAAIR